MTKRFSSAYMNFPMMIQTGSFKNLRNFPKNFNYDINNDYGKANNVQKRFGSMYMNFPIMFRTGGRPRHFKIEPKSSHDEKVEKVNLAEIQYNTPMRRSSNYLLKSEIYRSL